MLLLVFGTAKILSELCERIGQPGIVGEIIAGVILGPSVLNWVQPNDVLAVLSELGVMFLLFRVGLDLTPKPGDLHVHRPAGGVDRAAGELQALDGLVRRAGQMAQERDLGAYPTLFNDANRYADLLARELPRSRHGPKLTGQRILVVMPGGFGGRDLGDNIDGPLSKTRIDADAESNGLAVAAIGAVARLATANGHPVPVPPEASARVRASTAKKGGGPGIVVFLVPAVLLFVAIWAAGRFASRRSTTSARQSISNRSPGMSPPRLHGSEQRA